LRSPAFFFMFSIVTHRGNIIAVRSHKATRALDTGEYCVYIFIVIFLGVQKDAKS
jgi:hypothetical protein